MSKTIKREICNKCNKRNLSTWEYQGNMITKCKTAGCDNIMEQKEYVDSLKMNFTNIEKEYRGISPEICQYLGIQKCILNGIQYIQYHIQNRDNTVSKKTRYPNKIFGWEGKTQNTSMFGLDKCTNFDSPIVICEGGEDAASCWEIGFQACSLHSSETVEENIKIDLEQLNKFSEIIICIEDDHAGKPAKDKLKELLKHKRIREVDLTPKKDANEWLTTDNGQDRLELIKRIMEAKEIIPDGIVFGSNLQDKDLWADPPPAIQLPWKGLNDSLSGLEYGQLYALFGGSSIGKSSILRELVYYFRTTQPDLKIANIFLEENQRVTPLSYVALALNIPIGQLKRDKSLVSELKRTEVYNNILNTDKLMFINDKYQRDSETLLKTIEYLSNVHKYDIIILDHISYIIGRSKASKHGERRDIDELLYSLQDLARNLNIIIFFACHLSDPSSPPNWDEGRIPSLYNGRGSRVLAQVPDGIIGVSRNMIDQYSCDQIQLHCLKNRWDGKLGLTDTLDYISSTGRLMAR